VTIAMKYLAQAVNPANGLAGFDRDCVVGALPVGPRRIPELTICGGQWRR
jgi:hypothetical protein